MLEVLKGILVILQLLTETSKALQEIKAVLEKAKAEGRDVSDAEVAALKAKTDQLELDLRARLNSLNSQP